MSTTGTEAKKSKDVQRGPIHYPLWFGGSASCLAASVTHPLDLLRAVIDQAQLSASLLRQITYSTTRFGVYEELKEVFTTGVQTPSFPALIAMASTSG
ncbi:hypothetical protein B0A55_09959, partial [Friedmanniomyces simplex]